jgi:methionyl-tRNA formyltransferase
MRTLFIGGTRRGYQTLAALLDAGANITGIISLRQDEHEADRFEEPIRALAGEHGIPCYETKWLKDRDYAAILRDEIKPDIAYVVGCRILIPPDVYEIPSRGTLAVHDSLLPEYRGFAPLNWSILNGEDHTGVTLFHVSEVMDGGDIVCQKSVPIGPDDTAAEVYERVCQATVDVVLEAHPLLAAGTAPRIPQDYAQGSFTCSRSPAEGEIDWSKSTRAIYDQIRALTRPYPGAYTFLGTKKVIIWAARPMDNAPRYVGRIPGRVVGRNAGEVHVLTGDGILRLLEVQVEGEASAAAPTVFTSVRATLGLRAADLLERIKKLEELLNNK